jgi:23S rRNA pseudouridine1911/1915/1917 synthase
VGSTPPKKVPAQLAGHTLAAAVRQLFGFSWGKAREAITTGKTAVGGETCTDDRRVLEAGEELSLDMTAPRPELRLRERGVLVHLDEHLIVINKPAGLSTIPYEEGERGTLENLVRTYLARHGRNQRRGRRAAGEVGRSPERAGAPSIGVVHRLDKETSGLLVFALTLPAKRALDVQFREHTILRRYLAIVHGEAALGTLASRIVKDRGDGLRGTPRPGQGRGRSGRPVELAELGKRAVTHVEVLESLSGGRATLLACRLETGRTHQIRIHLSEAGHPLLGERVYIRDFRDEPLRAPRLMLHAAELGFLHPATGDPVRWEVPLPPDMREVLSRLRGGPTAR